MTVPSAIADHGLTVNQYWMINSAVSSECYSQREPPFDINMVHKDWGPFVTEIGVPEQYHKLFAYHWHTLFPAGDSRSRLTWTGRFVAVMSPARVGRVLNFWSKL